MSVCIKGFEMPTRCAECLFVEFEPDGYFCRFTGEELEYPDERGNKCPLFESDECQDLVWRNDAIQGIREIASCADAGHESEDYVHMLQHLPSAEMPKGVRTGKWVQVHG